MMTLVFIVFLFLGSNNRYTKSPNSSTEKKTKLANQGTARQLSHRGTPIKLAIK
jgi:hypothetical protein